MKAESTTELDPATERLDDNPAELDFKQLRQKSPSQRSEWSLG
jgi:hypothetical protein